MTLLRRTAATTLVTALAVVGVVLAAVPAGAVSSYRYWSYWTVAPSTSSWTYAGTGPAGHRVDDGGVEGWRFVVAAPTPSAPGPRTSAASAFHTICGSTDQPAGKDRVALVVDFGTTADAPPHESRPGSVVGTCVVVDDRSDGLDVLSAAGYAPRMGDGLVCGLSGYPAHECGVVVKGQPSPAPSKPKPTKPAKPPAPASTGAVPSLASPGGPGSASPTTPSASGPATTASPSGSSGAPTPAETPSTAAGAPALAVGPPPPPPGGTTSGGPVGLLVGAVLVLGVGAAALLRSRGRPHQGTP